MLAKPAGNQRPSFGCQFNPAHPAVVRVILARNEPFLTSRSTATLMDPGVSQTFGPMVFTGSGPLCRSDFQDAEIGVAQFCPLDALGRVREQRLKGFHENEPEMHAGGVLLLELFFSASLKFYLDDRLY